MNKFFTLAFAAALVSTAAQAGVYVPVLKEGFSRAESTTPGGGYYAESLYFQGEDCADNAGWTSNSTYESERAVKLNAKTKTGYITTPAINFSSDIAANVKVVFRAQTWKNDNMYVCVEIDGKPETVQKVDSDISTNITDRSEAPFELTFTNVAKGSKFKFYAEKRSDKLHRFFLSDIVVLEEVESPVNTVYSSAYYHLFNDLMAGNESEIRTIDINAVANTSPIVLAQEEKSNFKIEKADGWDDLKGGRLNIRFDAINAGSKLETLKITAGAATDNILLGGHAKVYAPTSAEPSDITDNSFTANWQKAPGMDNIILTVYTDVQGKLVAPNLMFTKYIEGSSNNRAVEIFNGTGEDINLKGWKFRMESNGSGGLTACEYDLPDKVLADGETFTLCNAQYSALRDIADATIGFSDGGYANFTTFTGDDALALFDPEDKLVDLLGYESYDCNDRISGNWGQDVTYYRNSDSYAPHKKFYVSEWTKHPKDYSEGYGTHKMDATGNVHTVVTRIELDGNATSFDVNNLAPGTEYKYVVEGLSNGLYTPVSDVKTAKTTGTSGVDNINIEETTVIEVYNLCGAKIADNTNGLDAGIYIVRKGSKVSKIMVE